MGFVLILALLRGLVELIPTSIEVGPETTVLDGPVRPDGTIDYATVLDAESAEGVEPDENAVVGLIDAFGIDAVYQDIRDQYLQRLRVQTRIWPEGGEFYVDRYSYLTQRSVESESSEGEAFLHSVEEAEQRPWTIDESPLVGAWLMRNDTPLQRILSATDKPKFYAPVVLSDQSAGLYDWTLPVVDMCVRAERLLMVSAMNDIARGDEEAAYQHILACHRLAQLLSQHPTLMAWFRGRKIKDAAMNGDTALILSELLSEDQCRRFRQQLSLISAFHDPVNIVDRTERFSTLSLVQAAYAVGLPSELASGDDPSPGKFDPNYALREVNDAYDDVATAMRIADRQTRVQALKACQSRSASIPDVSQNLLTLAKVIGSPYPPGQWYAKQVIERYVTDSDYLADLVDHVTAQVRLVDCGYSIAEYHARHHVYPKRLAELVADFVDAVPVDPFSSESLKYRHTDGGFLLYSVGPNGIDDGGNASHPGDDIAFGDRPEE